jgi:ribosomal protein S18 acetylase RimI-like enzyme
MLCVAKGFICRMQIRLLNADDAAGYHMLRLRGSQEAPDAFDLTYEEEQQQTLQEVAARLQARGNPPHHFVLGAFDEQKTLVGTVGLTRETASKMQHKAIVWGVYISPAVRRQGIAHALLHELLAQVRQLPELEQVHVGIVASNKKAQQLYTSLGFQSYGMAPRSMRLDLIYLDEELMLLSL